MWSRRVGHDCATSLSLFTFMHQRRKWQPTPVFLPGESQGWGSLVGCRLWGRTESDTTDATQQQQQQQAWQATWNQGYLEEWQYSAGVMKVKVAQLCLTLCDPMDYTVHGILQDRILEWGAISFSRGSSQPRDWTQSPTLPGDSLPAEPQGKPKNTGVGSLSLLQRIFLTQELNQGLLHCRQIH